MDEYIKISFLNDFVFCPMSIYFHNLYGSMEKEVYQSDVQYEGTAVHKTIDTQAYTSKKTTFLAISVFSERFHLVGKIDLYDFEKATLIERKKHVKTIYDGYIFQLYAQYYCLIEMGYPVNKMKIYSYDDNKSYPIPLPDEVIEMKEKFLSIMNAIKSFDMESFVQTNKKKCENCIYYDACDRGVKC